MNKQKIIENNSAKNKRILRKYQRAKFKNIDFESSPFRESMKKNHTQNIKHKWFFNYPFFCNFLDSKIGCDWDDVYSELIQKIPVNKRYYYDSWIYDSRILIYNVIYDDNGYPLRAYWGSRNLLYDTFFIDENNILSFYETKEELIIEYDIRLRKSKLLRLMSLIDEDE